METRFGRIEDKLDRLDNKLDDISVRTTENTTNLQEHMRRTALLEELVDLVRRDHDHRLKPVEKFIDRFKYTFYVVGIVGSVLVTLKELGVF